MNNLNETELGILKVERELSASVEEVFEAFSDPHKMSQWFFAFPGGSALIEQDFKVGGKYSVVMVPPEVKPEDAEEDCGAAPRHYGEYLEIDPPKGLSFTWINDGFVDYSVVTITFDPSPKGTLLTLVHKVPADKVEPHRHGWGGCLDNLELLLG